MDSMSVCFVAELTCLSSVVDGRGSLLLLVPMGRDWSSYNDGLVVLQQEGSWLSEEV